MQKWTVRHTIFIKIYNNWIAGIAQKAQVQFEAFFCILLCNLQWSSPLTLGNWDLVLTVLYLCIIFAKSFLVFRFYLYFCFFLQLVSSVLIKINKICKIRTCMKFLCAATIFFTSFFLFFTFLVFLIFKFCSFHLSTAILWNFCNFFGIFLFSAHFTWKLLLYWRSFIVQKKSFESLNLN